MRASPAASPRRLPLLFCATLAVLSSARGAELRVCTQNLWNFGEAREVQRLRRSSESLDEVSRDLDQRLGLLASRLASCDVVALQEIVGGSAAAAESGARRLVEALQKRTGARWAMKIGEGPDVIRNGILVRERSGRSLGAAPAPAPSPSGWERAPAAATIRAGSRVIEIYSVHLKSKGSFGREPDPEGESWERRRIAQASGLCEMARRRLTADGRAIVLIAGDFNNIPGSATREVAAGRLEPERLMSPRDCIGEGGSIACPLPRSPALLIDLAALDPDTKDRGSFRFQNRYEQIDTILASPEAARLAQTGSPGDWEVAITGAIGSGSDHRLVSVTLRY